MHARRGLIAILPASGRSRSAVWLAAAVAMSLGFLACGAPESPERAELRSRMAQEARLSDDELGRLLDEIAGDLEGKTVRITDSVGAQVPGPEPEAEVFSMLRNRIGVFDEGLRRDGEATYRVLNAPGKSDNAEIEASQRLWIDVATLLPRRYEFSYAFQGYGDYTYGVQVEP
jgi:hypothetical protein